MTEIQNGLDVCALVIRIYGFEFVSDFVLRIWLRLCVKLGRAKWGMHPEFLMRSGCVIKGMAV